MVLITSLSNKLVKEILESKAKGRKSTSKFLFLEGQRIVEEILSSHAPVNKLILSESSQTKFSYLRERYDTIVLSDKIFKEVSGTVNNQGVGLWVEKPQAPKRLSGRLFLVVDRVQDPGNLGTIIRTALGAGVDAIYLLKGTVDLYNEKVLRSTMGAIFKIPIYLDVGLEEVKGLMEENNLIPLMGSLDGQSLYNKIPNGKYVVFVGNEANGISKEVQKLEGLKVKIPLFGDIESLNVAVATGIILYGVKLTQIDG